MNLLLALTDAQFDRLFEVVILAFLVWLKYRQTTNRTAVVNEVKEAKKASETALNTANGHNEKIAAVTDALTEVKAVVEEVKSIATEAKK